MFNTGVKRDIKQSPPEYQSSRCSYEKSLNENYQS